MTQLLYYVGWFFLGLTFVEVFLWTYTRREVHPLRDQMVWRYRHDHPRRLHGAGVARMRSHHDQRIRSALP